MNKSDFIGIIPARYASTRFPGKPLAMLGGKTVIERVYTQAASVLDNVCVATDDERIFAAVKAFGGNAIMTRADHKSGTDRVWEAYTKAGINAPVVINIQGDEPFISPEQITSVMECFDDPVTEIATLGKPFESIEAVKNPNSPKIIVDKNSYALYFSRSVIPYVRGVDEQEWLEHYPYLKHLGLYAYRSEVLKQITALPQSPIEKAESLEQLRWLYNGYHIKVALTNIETVGIDTPADLERAERQLKLHVCK